METTANVVRAVKKSTRNDLQQFPGRGRAFAARKQLKRFARNLEYHLTLKPRTRNSRPERVISIVSTGSARTL